MSYRNNFCIWNVLIDLCTSGKAIMCGSDLLLSTTVPTSWLMLYRKTLVKSMHHNSVLLFATNVSTIHPESNTCLLHSPTVCLSVKMCPSKVCFGGERILPGAVRDLPERGEDL